jgi:uncharacterized protein YecE (DUF72 family)
MERRALVGTCGFAEAQARSFADFDVLEVQQSFYEPPRLATADGWRHRAPAGFVFTLKAWQLITHRATSPTYRRLKSPLSPAERAQTGDFRWNSVTRMAWQRTAALADVLDSEAVVFQTPRSFLPTDQNIRQLRRFFEAIDRRGRLMVFEPRGEAWDDEILHPLLRELELVHGIDPFLRAAVGDGARYYRLHGRPAYQYHYRYPDEALAQLKRLVIERGTTYVLFNNDSMAGDARRFRRLLGHEAQPR